MCLGRGGRFYVPLAFEAAREHLWLHQVLEGSEEWPLNDLHLQDSVLTNKVGLKRVMWW